MKRVVIVLAAAMAMLSCGQSNKEVCNIYGAIDNLNEVGYVYLTDEFSTRSKIDSAKIERGNTFHFKGVKHDPTLAQLILESGRPIAYLFVEAGNIRVAGDYQKSDIKAVGSPANDAFAAMMTQSQQYMSDYREAKSNGDETKAAEIEAAFDSMQLECWEKNKDNIFGLFMLRQFSYSESAVKMLAYLNELPENLKALSIAQRLKESSERKLKTEPQAEGSDYVPHYINIEQPNVKGEVMSLKSVVEKSGNRYVLLDFWASWCGPCMAEMPHLKEAYKLYHKKGFEIYGVSFDANAEAWKSAIEKQQMKWVNVSTLERFDNDAAKDYVVESIPTNFLIDCSNGVIVAKNLRGEDVIKKLAELLK